MKNLTIFFTALNFVFIVSCNSKKQPGEEYYDPNYKPKMDQAATETETDNAVADAGQTNNTATTNTADTNAAEQPAADMPAVTKPLPSGATIEGAPANKDEVKVAVVQKDKLKQSPAGENFEKGKTLISKSDCLACHKDDAKLVGPAYIDVAKKYEDTPKNIDYLANKIIKGGAGAWGEIPMSPHPTLPVGDAKEMARYILSLNK